MRNVYKKKKELHRSILLFCILLIIILLSTILGATSVLAKGRQSAPNNKYFTSYRVSKDETLWNIADNYISSEYESKDDYIQEVIDSNGLKTAEDLKAGQTIIVPYYASHPIEK